MSRILKIFAGPEERPAILTTSKLIEKYDAFVLVEADDTVARSLARKHPTEDITDQFALQLGERTVDTSKPRITAAGVTTRHPAYRELRSLPEGPHHYVVQFIGPIKQTWLSQLRATGAKLREPRGNFGYVIRATPPMLPEIARLRIVRWLGHLPHADRIAPAVFCETTTPVPRRRVHPGVYAVEVFASEDTGKIARAARALGFRILSQEPKARLLLVESTTGDAANRKKIQALSAVHGVRFVRQRVVPRATNNVATAIMANSYAALASSGLKLSGDGEIVAVCDTGLDTGDPRTIHPDFAGRIIAIKSYPITPDWKSFVKNPGADDGPADLDSGHGTHVAGSVLGNGCASAGSPAVIRGHAYNAKLVFQAVEQEMQWKPNAPAHLREDRYTLAGVPTNLEALFQYAYGLGARVHSNSWGCGDPGAYDDQCRQFDQFVWKHKDFCFVVAAGNDGTDTDGDGKINLGSVTSPATAKNCITVGACENLRPEFVSEVYGKWWPHDFPSDPAKDEPMAGDPDQVAAFSSRGPTTDGRVKPDVVAPGTFILSTRSTRLAPNNFAWKAYPQNKKYFYMGGTSMATPLTAGAVALLREFLRKKQGIKSPSAALLKATLIAGCERLPNTAPAGTILDPHQGFGRVNLDRSLRHPLCLIEGSALKTGEKFTAQISVSAGNLRIVMCYSDYPGNTLINNLNLIVTDPAGTHYTGNQPASGDGSLALDSANNVEVVDVTNARAGKWTIDVIASNVSHGPQDFAVVAVRV